MAALRASPAPPNGDAVIGGAGLRDAGLGGAEGTNHALKYIARYSEINTRSATYSVT